jgi:hypothetical protein
MLVPDADGATRRGFIRDPPGNRPLRVSLTAVTASSPIRLAGERRCK